MACRVKVPQCLHKGKVKKIRLCSFSVRFLLSAELAGCSIFSALSRYASKRWAYSGGYNNSNWLCCCIYAYRTDDEGTWSPSGSPHFGCLLVLSQPPILWAIWRPEKRCPKVTRIVATYVDQISKKTPNPKCRLFLKNLLLKVLVGKCSSLWGPRSPPPSPCYTLYEYMYPCTYSPCFGGWGGG